MKRIYLLPIVLLLTFGTFLIASNSTIPEINDHVDSIELSTENSELAFNTMMEVLTHKRCVNCHPADDQPNQGEDSHKHLFGIQRGVNNKGEEAVNCITCHQDTNNDFSGVPGAPEWAVAPKSMYWEGLTKYEIAKSMLDRNNNGDRSLNELEHHLTEHELVLWAWDPGVNSEGIAREKPPVPKEEYIAAVKEWIEGGAIVPEAE